MLTATTSAAGRGTGVGRATAAIALADSNGHNSSDASQGGATSHPSVTVNACDTAVEERQSYDLRGSSTVHVDSHVRAMPTLPEALHQALQGNWDGFALHLEEVPYSWTETDLEVEGKFFFVSFRDGEPMMDEFVDYVHGQVIPYCIPLRVREEYRRRFNDTNNYAFIQQLSDQARDLFIRARTSRPTSGEIGELILFMLLEAALGAPQLVCKMILKTSEEMPVHGSDAIHLMPGSTPNNVRLLWGESKIYASLSSALDEICTSIAAFIARSQPRSARKRDLDIIRDHLSVTRDERLSAAILDHFDPYSSQYASREEAFACFVGFDYSAYASLESVPREEVVRVFRERYTERITTACSLFAGKLRNAGLGRQRVYFFLIPFDDVASLRTRFFAKLGVAP